MLRPVYILLACIWAGLLSAQEMVIAPQYEDARPFHAGLAPVKQNGLWGLIDRNGTMVVAPQYKAIAPGREGLRAVQYNEDFDRWGFVDETGQRAHYSDSERVKSYRGGWAAVYDRFDESWQIIDREGRRVSSTRFDDLFDWEPPYALVRQGGEMQVVHISDPGYVNVVQSYDLEGYDDAYELSRLNDRNFVAESPSGLAMFRINTESGTPEPYISTVIWDEVTGAPLFFNFIRRVQEGFVAIRDNRQDWAFFHVGTGRMLWHGRFETIRSMSEGLAAVRSKGKWGYINRRGEWAFPPTYDRAFEFHEGYAVVRTGDLRGFLINDPDTGLREYLAPQFDDVYRFSGGLAPVKTFGLWGFIWDGSPPPGEPLRVVDAARLVPE